MKFIADVMLGRLAKRLRLLGFDVLYGSSLDDNELIRLSLEQDRVILTRDAALAARPLAANHLFIKSERIRDQLHQVLSAFPAEALPLTRCSRCNEPLRRMAKQDIADLVPSHVFETQEEFFKCEACGRIYWRGTHVKRMEWAGIKKSRSEA
jgi:hypothetical protein